MRSSLAFKNWLDDKPEILEPETILPEQFYKRTDPLSREQKLWLSVVETAIRDYQTKKKHHSMALAWLIGLTGNAKWVFEEALGIDHDYIIRMIQTRGISPTALQRNRPRSVGPSPRQIRKHAVPQCETLKILHRTLHNDPKEKSSVPS